MPSPLPSLVLGLSVALAGGLALSGHLPASPAVPPAATSSAAAPVAAPAPGPVRAAGAVQPVSLEAAPAAAPATTTAAHAELLAEQTAQGLTCSTSLAGTPLCVHGQDAPPEAQHVASTGGSGSGSGRIGCYGDGTSGPRVRALYARAEGSPDRFAASLPSFTRWAAGVSGQVDDSAAVTGGRRHVRFATTSSSSCSLVVTPVVLPASAFSSFAATVDALQARGFTTPWSKYLVWADVDVVCGMATTFADDRPGPNLNDSSAPGYARVDRRCWGAVEAHEVVHLLGGVQRSARNSTGGFHCNDGSDVMCYADGTERSTQRSVCPTSRARLLDCGNDDYFSTAPPAGSYLATHWNTARSSFLATGLTDPPPPSPRTASPAPQPSPSARPSDRPSGEPSRSVLAPVLEAAPVPAVTRPAPSVPPLPAPALLSTATSLLGR